MSEMMDFRTGEIVEIKKLVTKDANGDLIVDPVALEIIEAAERMKNAIDDAYKGYKVALRESMEEYGVDSIKTDVLTVSYKKGYWREGSIDKKKLEKEFPQAFKRCLKDGTFVGATVSVRVKDKK